MSAILLIQVSTVYSKAKVKGGMLACYLGQSRIIYTIQSYTYIKWQYCRTCNVL